MAEAGADIDTYPTLEDLFVRKLRPGTRRIDPEPSVVVSPVDGTWGAQGTVTAGTILQVKGRSYSLAALLGSAEDAERYEGGHYVTIYLAPRDYHRIHTPLSGRVTEAVVIPGALMPVFPEALERVDGLFARNERIVTYLDTPNAGRLAVVKVGATLVGRISLAYDQDIWSNRPGQQQRRVHYDPPRMLQKGGEVGAFELGSTVVLVCEAGQVTLDAMPEGTHLRMGQRIGQLGKHTSRSASGPTQRHKPRRTPGQGASKNARRPG